MKILITENQLRNLTDVLINEENDGVKYAIIKILKPLAYMDLKYYYQEVPLWHTKEDMITVKKGGTGRKTISTKNIEVVKVFDSDNEELKEYLKELRKNQKL